MLVEDATHFACGNVLGVGDPLDLSLKGLALRLEIVHLLFPLEAFGSQLLAGLQVLGQLINLLPQHFHVTLGAGTDLFRSLELALGAVELLVAFFQLLREVRSLCLFCLQLLCQVLQARKHTCLAFL